MEANNSPPSAGDMTEQLLQLVREKLATAINMSQPSARAKPDSFRQKKKLMTSFFLTLLNNNIIYDYFLFIMIVIIINYNILAAEPIGSVFSDSSSSLCTTVRADRKGR